MPRLVTTCPACRTMFKVVADQLKISEGWVRCGQCGHVFHAPLHFEAFAAPDPAGVSDSQFLDFDPDAWRKAREGLRLAAASVTGAGAAPVKTPEKAAEKAVEPFQPQPLAEGVPQQPPRLGLAGSSPADAGDEKDAGAESHAGDTEDAVDVSFVQEARRKAFWQKTSVRCLLAGVSLLLVAVLALQGAVHYRDYLVAKDSRLLPALQTICGYANCQIKALRDIDSFFVESASLSKTDSAGLNLRLGFVLKNKSSIALEAPMLELTLTDAQDKAYLRRVLTPAQYGATAALQAPLSDFAGTVDFAMTNPVRASASGTPAAVGPPLLPPVGYLVVAFYP